MSKRGMKVLCDHEEKWWLKIANDELNLTSLIVKAFLGVGYFRFVLLTAAKFLTFENTRAESFFRETISGMNLAC